LLRQVLQRRDVGLSQKLRKQIAPRHRPPRRSPAHAAPPHPFHLRAPLPLHCGCT
jgi:hypothetical protein